MARSLAHWLEHIEQQHPRGIELGLDRTRAVADRLNIGKPATHVITVGGTNGKGSTVAFVEAIARSAGWRVGAYTSPHLLRYNERVRIDGVEAEDAKLVAAFEAVEAARAGTELTYFEFGTLAALWLFGQARLDLAVLEVGLGGRLDAVNIIDPDVAVITTVDIDHVEWLGSDRESIGFEKAGTARAWKPLVLGEVDSPASVLRHAYAIGANAIRLGSDFFHESIDVERWRWREVGTELELPNPTLAGPVQRGNAATAIAAIRALPADIPLAAFAKGVASARIQARLQRFQYQGREVLVDVAHNPQAARALAAWLQAEPVEGRTLAVLALLSDKDAVGVVEPLAAHVDQWFLADLDVGSERSQSAGELAENLLGTDAAVGSRHATVTHAIEAAHAISREDDRILVFGSFHVAADAITLLHSGQ